MTSIKTSNWISSSNHVPVKPSRKKQKYNLPVHFNVTDHLFDDNNIPDQIIDSYDRDYDILHVHDIVMCHLNQEKSKLPELNKTKAEIEERLKGSLKVVDRKRLNRQLEEIINQIDNINTETKKKRYIEATKDYIEAYRKLGPMIGVSSFIKTDPDVTVEISEERIKIIEDYLNIAKEYMAINVVRIISHDQSCPGCGQELSQDDPDNYMIERCNECGYERLNFIRPTIYRDVATGKVKSSNTSEYEDKENFLKALECYLGEQQLPSPSVFQALDEWAASYNHPPKEVIWEMPLNQDGTRGEYGKSMLMQALSETGYSCNYRDIRLIGHLQWNWKLPNLSHQDRDIIERDYDATQAIFDAIPKERKSSLNTQYRLFRHLQARGHNVRATDFKIPKTPSIIDEHDGYWREMIKAIPGAKFTSLK